MKVPRLWHNRDLMILTAGRGISELGSAMSFVAMPLLAVSLGPEASAGYVLAAMTISGLTVSLYAGAVADRVSRRALMLASMLVRAGAYGWIVLARSAGILTITQLLAVAVVVGAAAPFFGSAEKAAIRQLVPAGDLPAAYTQNQVRSSAADLGGSPAGGALYALASALPFAADALSFLVEAFALLLVRTPLPAPEHPGKQPPFWSQIGEGARFVLRNPFLRAAILAVAATNFVSVWPAVLLTLHDRGISPTVIGACLTLITGGTLGGAMAAPAIARRLPPGKAIMLSAWWLVVALTILAIDPSTLILIVGLTVALLGVPVFDVLLSSYEALVTPDAYMGRVTSVNRFVGMLGIPAGQAIGAALVASSGPRAAFAVYAGAALAGALVLSSTKAVRSLQRPPAEQPAPD
jgi:predicted MFS family arabinose efflux permease